MGNKEKLFRKFDRHPWPTDVSFEELVQLLKYCGFLEGPAISGSHNKFTHPKLEDPIILPKRNPMKSIYVKKVIEAIKSLEN